MYTIKDELQWRKKKIGARAGPKGNSISCGWTFSQSQLKLQSMLLNIILQKSDYFVRGYILAPGPKKYKATVSVTSL